MKKVKDRLSDVFKNRKNVIYYLYGIVAVLACLFTMKPLCGQISESIRILAYMSLVFSMIYLQKNVDKVYTMFYMLWHKILLFLLELYAVFATVGMYVLDNNVENGIRYPAVIYLGIAYIWVRPVVIAFLALLFSITNSTISNKRTVKLQMKLGLVCITMLPCILFLIGFNPAITSRDSQYCYEMAHTIWENGVTMADWHPPFYVFVLSILFKICDSITFIVVLQIISFAVVFVDGILYFYNKGLSKPLLAAIYCFITFGVSNIIMLVTFWKDIPFMISIMWLTILLIKYSLDKEIYENKLGWYIQVIVALVFTAFFRQNGIVPAFAVIALLPIVSKMSKRVIAVSAICLFLLFVVKRPLYTAMEVTPAPQLKFFSLANDIMYSYYRGDTISEEAMEVVNKVTSGDPDNYEYSPYGVYYNNDEPNGYTLVEFLKIYMDNVIRNPRDAVMAVLCRNSDIWSIVKPANEFVSCVNYLDTLPSLSETNRYPDRKINTLTIKLSNICDWIRDNSILYVLYWRTGIYNLLLILMIGVLFSRIRKPRWEKYILPFVPICMNLLALFITSGWSDYRYFWPSMAISLLLLCYFAVIRDNCVEEVEGF